MRKLLVTTAVAATLAGSAFAIAAFAAPGDPPPDGPRHYGMEDRGFMLDARLAGMKAALKLTPEQEKLWTPFETAVRDMAKSRGEEMRAMRDQREEAGARPSPIARMDEMADHMAKESAELKQVASAAKPLFDALDEPAKRHFGPLLMTLREPAPRPPHPPMEGPGGPRPGEDMQ
jgi:Spy/CpxP family protein refolding chaperone